jgi:mRNA-degrading endonuclease YafQ of YafQ-DinJ toxin-antitoxin module
MKIIQSRIFAKTVQKFNKQQKSSLDKVVSKIANNPKLGKQKKGDLKDIWAIKFKIGVMQYLLAYRFNNKNLELIKLGVHENYYRDLKQQIN